MKELDSFTVEQLNDFIKSDHTQCGDVAALARIALAAKRAEPVGYLCEWDNGNQVIYYGEAGNALDDDWSSQPSVHKNLPIYTTPQLNSPEIPEGWKLVPIELTAEMAQAAGEAHEGESYLPYSIYRAMLAAAPEKENG
ncbi:TPA: hypothetical protein RJI64_004306 [Yersinia enterocolitica]|nr:hypothetical protein [Yersinia enterocolitica]HDV5954624.1 hypothetical protein [Yersinia enterocolitica]HDV7153994.1 hypothetical protein [Yersinia enterocolitica]HED5569232.1 hypothetical protein [Yersinia enterocolitica]